MHIQTYAHIHTHRLRHMHTQIYTHTHVHTDTSTHMHRQYVQHMHGFLTYKGHMARQGRPWPPVLLRITLNLSSVSKSTRAPTHILSSWSAQILFGILSFEKSLLTHRLYILRIGVLSATCSLAHGVPQGLAFARQMPYLSSHTLSPFYFGCFLK
jgi:hypothetical protein